MKKITFTFIAICFTAFSFAQTENDKLIELGKAYKDFMFRNEPPKGFVKNLQSGIPDNLKTAASFVVQTISTDNDILKPAYLTLPDTKTLKFIYIIHAINNNLRDENQIDNNKLIDSLEKVDIPRNEQVDNYYNLLFTSVGNKIKPFNLSKIDFKLSEYNLANDTEKGIFFLRCMNYCGTEIWGYMNIVRPPNTGKALEYINKFPKFNGLKYYQFNDLTFPDFEMVIIEDKGKQSYKSYYIDKYYNVLLSHLICLDKEGAKEKEVNDLLLGSVLRDQTLYKYTKSKDTLEKLFKEQK